MTRFDFEKFLVGFDNLVNTPVYTQQITSYPRYNIEKTDSGYVIQLAVPGWKKDQISINVADQILSIKGEKQDSTEEKNWIHKGISGKSFSRYLKLDDSLEVSNATMEDGLLNIDVTYVEAAKPKVITIL